MLLGILGVALGGSSTAQRAPPTIVFRELAAESGVVFRFETGTRGRHDLPEIMGGGLALIDGDGDGDLDLFLCAGGPIVPPPSRRNACRYFQNNGRGEWIDATAHANAPGPSYAMGAAVGDFDADGRDDLFVSGWREQRLYRNRGHGRFEDVTERRASPRTVGRLPPRGPIWMATATSTSTFAVI